MIALGGFLPSPKMQVFLRTDLPRLLFKDLGVAALLKNLIRILVIFLHFNFSLSLTHTHTNNLSSKEFQTSCGDGVLLLLCKL